MSEGKFPIHEAPVGPSDSFENVPTDIERDPRAELDTARKRFAAKEADYQKYRGLAGMFRFMISPKKESSVADEFFKARGEYQELRAEVIGDDVMKMVEEAGEKTKAAFEVRAERKGFMGKTLEAVRKVHRKLGEWNLEKLGWKPEGRFRKMVAKGANARLVVNFVLLGGGIVAGGGTAALGALAARRLLGGLGAGYGSYDFMRMKSEKTTKKETLEGLESAEAGELVERLERLEARAMVDGKDLTTDDNYLKLKAAFGQRFGGTAVGDDGEPVKLDAQDVATLMEEKDKGVAKLQDKYGAGAALQKIMAVGIGFTVGSGLLAHGFRAIKHAWSGAEAAIVLPDGNVVVDSKGLMGTSHRVVEHTTIPSEKPPVEELASAEMPEIPAPTGESEAAILQETSPVANPEILKLAEIHKGDGVIKIVSRQLEAKPEAWGYDAAKDGDLHKWASKMTHQLMQKNGISGDIRLKLDVAHPGHVLVSPDGKIDISDAKTYLRKGIPVSEMEDPFEHDTPGKHVPIDKMEDPFEKMTTRPKVSELPDPFEHLTRKPTVGELPDPFEHATAKPKVGDLPDPFDHATAKPTVAELPDPFEKMTAKPKVGELPDPFDHMTRKPTVGELPDPFDNETRAHQAAFAEHTQVDKALKTFADVKLSATARLDSLRAICPEGKTIEINGLDIANKGGRIIAKIGQETLVVTPKNIGDFSKLAEVMSEAERAVADPKGYQADLDSAMEDLGLVRPDAK